MSETVNRTQITVTVTESRTYRFPAPDARCPAHGQELCIRCARNPSGCDDPDRDDGGCSVYSDTGMHWDTCPNRIR